MTDHHPGHDELSREREHGQDQGRGDDPAFTEQQSHDTGSSESQTQAEKGTHDREHDREEPSNKWVKDAEEALAGAGEAIRTAWDASRDARMTALEAARKAVEALGDAVDQGLSAARSRKQEQGEAPTAGGEPAPGTQTAPPPPPAGDDE